MALQICHKMTNAIYITNPSLVISDVKGASIVQISPQYLNSAPKQNFANNFFLQRPGS